MNGPEGLHSNAGKSRPSIHPPPWGRGDGWTALGVLVASLAFHLLYFRHGVQNLVDLGVACVDANRLLLGQLPGRDFMESYGPGRFVLTAFSFALAGKSLLTFSALCTAFLALKDLLLYRAARFLLSRPWALYLCALCIVVHGPLHKAFLSFSLVLVLLSLLGLVDRVSPCRAFLLGGAVACAGLFRYDVGAAGFLIALPVLILLPRVAEGAKTIKNAAVFALGLLLAGGPYLCYLVMTTDLPRFLSQHMKRLHSLELANAGAPGVLDLPSAAAPEEYLFGGLLLLMAVVVVVAAVFSVRTWRGGGPSRRRALALGTVVLLALFAFNQVRLGVKFSRFAQITPPFFLMLVFLLEQASLRARSGNLVRGPWIRIFPPLAAGIFFAALTGYLWTWQGRYSQDSFAVLRLPEYYLRLPRAKCFFKYKKGKEIEHVVEFIRKYVPEGRPIFTGPSCPLFHFLAERPNPTPFTDFTFYYFDEENQRTVIRRLEEARVPYIVNWPRQLTGFLFTESAPLLAVYIKTHFRLDRYIGRFAVLKRVQ